MVPLLHTPSTLLPTLKKLTKIFLPNKDQPENFTPKFENICWRRGWEHTVESASIWKTPLAPLA